MASEDSKRPMGIVFEMERVFHAPRGRVWQAWSDAEQLRQWWGPSGCSVEIARFEFRPGGFLHYAMKFADAPTMWGRFNYREIAAPERIIWLNSFSNERCGIARAPFSGICPLEIENTVVLAEQGESTVLRLHAEPFGASEEERRFFAELCSSRSLEQGYSGTFEQLAAYLSKAEE